MSIGVRRVLLVSLSSSLFPSLFYAVRSLGGHTDGAHRSKHIQSPLPLSPPSPSLLTGKHKHIKSRSFTAQTRSHKHPGSVEVYSTEETQTHEKCMSLCLFHKKHSSGFHPHLSCKTTQEYQLRSQFGRQCRQDRRRRARIRDRRCHLNEGVTVSCRSRGHAAGVDSKTHFGLSVMEMLSGTAGEL